MINFRKIIIVFILTLFLLSPVLCYASSNYVLPYPSSMPGSKIYSMHVLWEKALRFWYFGDFGQFEYNLKESDKYLVEAKTLFEYKQYLLGYSALQKSNAYFKNTLPYLISAKKHGKNILEKENILKEASLKHDEVLSALIQEAPSEFRWNPEKASPQDLNIAGLIQDSLSLRRSDEKINF
jgi:hypothetical protein